MIRQRIQSSRLKTVGYDKKSRVLEVEYPGGGVFQFYGVPETVFLDLMAAASKGTYFDNFIFRQYESKGVA